MPDTTGSDGTLFDLPDHYVKDRALWRRKVMRSRGLSYGARWYAGYLAFHRFGKGRVAWVRDRAARACGVTARTISRWTAELVDGGWLERVVSGMPGRCQVFRLVSAQVGKGDTTVSPSGERLPYRTRRATSEPSNPSPKQEARRTTAGRPAHYAAAAVLSRARPAGDVTHAPTLYL